MITKTFSKEKLRKLVFELDDNMDMNVGFTQTYVESLIDKMFPLNSSIKCIPSNDTYGDISSETCKYNLVIEYD